MNITELMYPDQVRGTSLEDPALWEAYREMTVPAGPGWVEEHLRRLRASNIQPHFQLTGIHSLETTERLIRRGFYNGPLNITWVGIGGGFDGPNPYNFIDFVRRCPDGATITAESIMKNVLPINMMALAMGLHTRVGIEDTIIDPRGKRFASVAQIEQCVRLADELGREVATATEAREIYKIGVWYDSVDQTLSELGFAPNRTPGQRNAAPRAA